MHGYGAESLGSIPSGPARSMPQWAREQAVQDMLEGERLRRQPPVVHLPPPLPPDPAPEPMPVRPIPRCLQEIGLQPHTVAALARKYSLP
jgi:hypothetical protein